MNKVTTNILLMLLTIIAATIIYIFYCSECGINSNQDPPMEQTVVPKQEIIKTSSFPFSLSSDGFTFNSEDNYNFNISSNTPILPLSDNLNQGISGLANYLKTNTNEVVDVTGYYLNSEENPSAFPNLGLARANAIKNDLASKGIATSQINTLSKLMPDMVPTDNVLMGAAGFDFSEKSEESENEMNALYTKIKANPLILYFNTAEASINLSEAQRQKIAEISRYLDKVEGSKVLVTGHTDNTGRASTNQRLGMDRANFAKDYLVSNGIANSAIIASSKGESEPIADNRTEDGRNQNRRTVITLK